MSERSDREAWRNARLFVRGKTAILAAAPYGQLARHSCGSPVLIVALDRPFEIAFDGEIVRDCDAAVLKPGVQHAIDCMGGALACLWLMPAAGNYDMLLGLLNNPEAKAGGDAATGVIEDARFFERAYAGEIPAGELEAGLGEFVAALKARSAPYVLDPRVERVLELLGEASEAPLSVAEAAESVGLSSSRLQYVFSRDVGVPFRRYRAWLRLCDAVDETARGANLTEAAHAAGFADLAHFSNEYRRTFGDSASHLMAASHLNRPVVSFMQP